MNMNAIHLKYSNNLSKQNSTHKGTFKVKCTVFVGEECLSRKTTE